MRKQAKQVSYNCQVFGSKNVPRHILAPAAVACDIYLIRRSSPLQCPSAFRTILKVFFCRKSTVTAMLHTIFISTKMQGIKRNLRNLSSGNCLAYVGTDFGGGITAIHAHIVVAVPFKQRNKKERKEHVSHIHFQMSIFSAAITYF